MTKQKTVPRQLTREEWQIIEQLRQHPEMMARFESILAITRNADGPLQTADEVEELLIQEMRRVGNAAMTQWAVAAEARVGTELKEKDPTVRHRKKKR